MYEAPGAIALIAAHSALEDVVLTKDEARLKRPLEQRWTELVYEGRWFSPAREAIDAFVDSTQQLVTGEVRLELRPNAAVVTGGARRISCTRRSSPRTEPERPSRTRRRRASSGSRRSRRNCTRLAQRGVTRARHGLPRADRPRLTPLRAPASGGGEGGGGGGSRAGQGRSSHPDVWEFLRADDAELLPYDCEACASTRSGSSRPDC